MKRNRLLSIYLSLIIVLLCGCEMTVTSEPNIDEEETYSSVTNPKDSECSDEYNCTGQFLSDDTFNDPVATAEKLLSHAFSFDPDAYASTVSQNDDFWNITFDGEHNYVVELTPALPYPQTLYEYRNVPSGSYSGDDVLTEDELVDIAEVFLFNVYAVKDAPDKVDVFHYGSKICVQFIMDDTHIFQVRIHKGDFKPSGILFFNNIEAAEKAVEKAPEIQEKVEETPVLSESEAILQLTDLLLKQGITLGKGEEMLEWDEDSLRVVEIENTGAYVLELRYGRSIPNVMAYRRFGTFAISKDGIKAYSLNIATDCWEEFDPIQSAMIGNTTLNDSDYREYIRNKYNVDEISTLYNVDAEIVIDVLIEGPTLDKFSPFTEIMDRCASIDRRTFIQGLSYDLPEGLRLGEYDSTIEAGGYLLLPYAYFNESDSAPEYWKSAGAISCFMSKGSIKWNNDEIIDVNLQMNHTSYEKIGPIQNVFWPAYLLKAEHDLMTHPELMEYEESGSPDNIDTTSEYWYVVFAEPETDYGLLVSLATREYTKEDMIAFASSFSAAGE